MEKFHFKLLFLQTAFHISIKIIIKVSNHSDNSILIQVNLMLQTAQQ